MGVQDEHTDAYIAEGDDIVGIVHNAKPRSDEALGVASGSNLAIEIDGGQMRRWGADENWFLELPEELKAYSGVQ